jgi:hypothetical protein
MALRIDFYLIKLIYFFFTTFDAAGESQFESGSVVGVQVPQGIVGKPFRGEEH